VVLAAVVTQEGSSQMALALPLRTLSSLQGPAVYSESFTTAGLTPGYYRIDVQMTDKSGTILDTQTTTFRLGSPSLETTGLTAVPDWVRADSPVVRNTGPVPVSGTAVIRILGPEGDSVAIFEHPFVGLEPAASLVVGTQWDPSGIWGNAFQILAQVLYDGNATVPLVREIGRCGGGLFPADITRDCYVDMRDLAALALAWMRDDCGAGRCPADIELNGTIDLGDALVLAGQWLWCNDPAVSRCDPFWK
jgi:hypothetical protein